MNASPTVFLQQIGAYNTITVGADSIRPQPYRMDSTHIHRKYSKTGTFRADIIRPYGAERFGRILSAPTVETQCV